MAIQYVDAVCDACGNVAGPYNISGSNDQFSIAIDGGSNQVFTLTHGATQTAANVVTDLAALTSATASVVSVNGSTYVRIRTTSASGAASTVLVNAPGNNANTLLGFVATTYNGGTEYNNSFVSGGSGTDKQSVINGIETALNAAGWITVSGHASTPCVMQSQMSPDPQNLRTQIKMTVGTNTALISIQNVAGTKVGTNSSTGSATNGCAPLIPGTSKTFRVIANKYQAFIFVPGSNNNREFAAFGVPWIPTFLRAGQSNVIYEAIWLNGNSLADPTATVAGSLRGQLGTYDGANIGVEQMICNGNIWEFGNGGTDSTNIGHMNLITMMQGTMVNKATASWYRWHDQSAFMTDPLIAWGLTAKTDEALCRGQLWEAFISTEQYTVDSTITSLDSHNWWCVTNNNGGSATGIGYDRGSLFLVAP